MVNLTIFSAIIEILFVQQDYRTINFLTESRDNEILNGLMRIASDSLKPISNFVVGKRNTKRYFQEEPILNVVVPNNSSNRQTINDARKNIFPDDVTLILMLQDTHFENIELWMNLSVKIILLTDNLTIYSNTYRNEFVAEIISLPFDPVPAQSLIATILSKEFYLRQSQQNRKFEILFQHLPPRSIAVTLTPMVIAGPDGSLAHTLVKWLKLKPTFCCDLAWSYPEYTTWKDDSYVIPRMYLHKAYPKYLTKNLLTIFDKK